MVRALLLVINKRLIVPVAPRVPTEGAREQSRSKPKGNSMRLKLPHPLGTYRSKKYFRYIVRLSQSTLDSETHTELEVVAKSPAAA